MQTLRSLVHGVRPFRGRLAMLGLVFAVLGCEDAGTEPEPGATAASLEFVVDESAVVSAEAGRAITQAPGVRARDAQGNPVRGVEVTFSTNSGEIVGPTRVTGDDGIARPWGWNLGPEAGPRSITATAAGGVSDTLTIDVGPQPAARIIPVSSQTQTGTVSSPTGAEPTVRVEDVFGNPVPGVTVSFTVTGGGGQVESQTAVTDSLGIASVRWTLGIAEGANSLEVKLVEVPEAPVVTFTANAFQPTGWTLQEVEGDDQSVPAITLVPVRPAVRVVDSLGTPVAGVLIRFEITSGNGSIAGDSVLTDATGVARLGGFAVGASGSTTVRAYVSVAQTLTTTFTATASTTAPFAITYRYVNESGAVVNPKDPRQLQAFVTANQRFARSVTGDLSNELMNIPSNQCGNHPAVNESVDDVLIFVALVPIDGEGNVLGSAGPCYIRSNGIPLIGRIRLDVADLDRMVTNGVIDDVVTHEIGHVLGIGSLWNLCINSNNEYTTSTSDCVTTIFALREGTGTDDVSFVGANAKSAYAALGGPSGANVPVENTGGAGTQDSHWRETTFFDELMTGFVQSARQNPMSQITIGSLADMGYTTSNAGAEAYTLPVSARMAEAAALLGSRETIPLNDLVEKPRFVKRRSGEIERVLNDDDRRFREDR